MSFDRIFLSLVHVKRGIICKKSSLKIDFTGIVKGYLQQRLDFILVYPAFDFNDRNKITTSLIFCFILSFYLLHSMFVLRLLLLPMIDH